MNPATIKIDPHSTVPTPSLNHLSSDQIRHLSTKRTATHRLPPKRSGFAISWLLAATVAVVGTTVTVQPWKSLPTEDHSVSDGHPIALRSVEIERPTPATTSQVVLPATLHPWQTTTLHARVNGYLAAWHHDLGATVKAGELLAEIETPELDQEVAQGEALTREAASAVVQAQAERVEAQADLQNAEAQLLRTQAELRLARSQLGRRDELVKNKIIPQEDYDTALRQVEAGAADVTAAEADVTRRRANLETRAAIITVRQSTAENRQSNVDRLKELQRFQRIVAPFDGVVTRRNAEVGMLVNAGNEPLFVLQDMHRIRVQISVPQTYSMQLQPGVPATVRLPESTEPAVAGTITRVAASVESASRTMLAEIELENHSLQLQPGSYAQVTLTVPQNATIWTIPTNTLSMRVDGPHVAVVNDQDQVELRRVQLGRDLGTRVVVTEGIQGNERLVVNPRDDLANGTQIQSHERPTLARLDR